MTASVKPRAKPYLALVVGVVCLGFSGIFLRWANAPGVVASFYRLGIGALLMAVPFYRRWKARGGLPWRGVRLALLGGAFFATDIGFWASGVMLSGATNPTLVANAAPVWVGLGALLFFREKLKPKFWAGLFLAVGGAVLVLGFDTLRSASIGIGTLFGLVSSFFYGGFFLITQRTRESLDSLSSFWIAAACSSVLLLLAAKGLGQPLTGYPPTTYLHFIGMAVVSQVTGYLAINYALGHLPSTIVSPTLLGQPVVTAILELWFFGSALKSWQMIGGAGVLLGVYLVHVSRRTAVEAPMQ